STRCAAGVGGPASKDRFSEQCREAAVGSRDWLQPARTLRTRPKAEGGESPMAAANEPVRAMTEGECPPRRRTTSPQRREHPSWAKRLWALGGLLGRMAAGLIKPAPTPCGLRRRGCWQTRSGGGEHEPAFKPLQVLGRPTDDMPRFQTGLGKSDCPAL